ncbi:MAG: SRPBCC domain-containing protein [Polyangiaceae bacterium]|jgi:hypothetical protein|nr:SRPBCC domain-containing protein [Polyangiaceae bacterium]
MREIHTEIEIGASADRIWKILTEFGRYPDWNPFLRWVRGRAEVGRSIAMRINPPNARAATMHGRIVEVRPRQRLGWSGATSVPGLLHMDHLIELVSMSGDRMLVTHRESASGALPWLHWDLLACCYHAGTSAMNRALKTRAEA